MPDLAMLDYFYGDEAEQFTFYRIDSIRVTLNLDLTFCQATVTLCWVTKTVTHHFFEVKW